MIDRGGRPTETRARWLQAWNLVADGAPIRTRSSVLLPVTRDGRPAMLKVPFEEEERRGGRLMAWWAGNGGAPVLAHDDGVVLLARADGPADLGEMARQRRDDEACRILVAVAARLHAPRPGALLAERHPSGCLFRNGLGLLDRGRQRTRFLTMTGLEHMKFRIAPVRRLPEGRSG